MKKYYYKLDGDTYKFYEVSGYDIELLEFSAKEIKYRFKDIVLPEGLEQMKYWDYKKLLNKVIFKK